MIWLRSGVGAATTFAALAVLGVAASQRDATVRQGTAQVQGTVVTGDTDPRPVRRAVVSVTGPALPLGAHGITDGEGRFVINNLPAGRYQLTASRASFVSVPFGASRPGAAGSVLQLSEGQSLTGVRLQLVPGAIITGIVRDMNGEPWSAVDVRITPITSGVGAARAKTVKTDDQGVYRAYGLAPGRYTVAAVPSPLPANGALVARSDAEVDAVLRLLRQRALRQAAAPIGSQAGGGSLSPMSSLVPMFYGGAFQAEDAPAVRLTAGEERTGIDIDVRLMTTATVSGVVHGNGADPARVEVALTPAGTADPARIQRARAMPDGRFQYLSVLPGRYLLSARVDCTFAAQAIEVRGAGVTGVQLALQPCVILQGRVQIAADARSAPPNLSSVRVALEVDTAAAIASYVPLRAPAAASSDGRFALGDVADVLPGSYWLRIQLPDRGWSVESATVDGRDVLDHPLQILGDDSRPAPVVVTLTDRVSELVGKLDAAGALPSDYAVLAFSTNPDWWRAPFRRIRVARPTADGRYALVDLPPGDYFVAALTDLAPDDWRDPAFLETVVPSAVKLTVRRGEPTVQDFRIGR